MHSEFGKGFANKTGELGVLRAIGARAPRHGGLAKEIFSKLCEDAMPTNEDEEE